MLKPSRGREDDNGGKGINVGTEYYREKGDGQAKQPNTGC